MKQQLRLNRLHEGPSSGLIEDYIVTPAPLNVSFTHPATWVPPVSTGWCPFHYFSDISPMKQDGLWRPEPFVRQEHPGYAPGLRRRSGLQNAQRSSMQRNEVQRCTSN